MSKILDWNDFVFYCLAYYSHLLCNESNIIYTMYNKRLDKVKELVKR